ncbi:MAG: tetratricopeptide (TPR) repeat protein, partial [Verrucomicrobiales bacterium]
EQWERPDDIDHRADIFAFGMIFYELLTSEVPSGMIELPSTKTSVDKRADDIVRKCLAPNPDKRYGDASELETDLMALERTTSITSGSSKDDSWLRPPPVALIEEEADDLAVTVMDSSATFRPALQIPKAASKNRWLGWLAALFAVVALGAFFAKSRKAQVSSDVRMTTLPALKGPWWFEDMPYLIPPVRQRLTDADLLGLPQTAEDVQAFEAHVVQAVRKLSETTTDSILSEVLEGLLKRSLKADEVLLLIPEELGRADPAWQHTRANLAHHLGNVSVAEAYYRDAIRGYRADVSEQALIGLCYSDLARSYATSGRNEDAVEAYDRAMVSVSALEVPFFQVACLAGKADACRRFEAWEEAEQALLDAKLVLEDAGVEAGHPLMTYILQRFGWLYMDDWKLGDGLIAFKGAIDSRQRWLEIAADPSLTTQLHQQHDELALAMCQRYSGHTDEAIAGYERVRKSLNEMRQRVNRTPSAQRDWYGRYYNNSERLGDCYLFADDGARQAGHHFHQAASDLGRELEAMKPEEAPVFRPQYGRLLAKEAIAQVLDDGGLDDLSALKVELGSLDLAGDHKTLLELFVTIAEIIVSARQDADVTAQVSRLEDSVRTNQDKQFGRDVRELFLLVCRELAPKCEGDNARKLASVITRLLPRDPVDKSVLPFLRGHFDSLIELRVSSDEMNWDIVRDMHWAKTGSRLGEDLPEVPVVTFYLESDRGYVIRMDPDGTAEVVRIDSGYEELEALPESEEVMRWLAPAGSTRIYWADEGLIPPMTRENFPFESVEEPS